MFENIYECGLTEKDALKMTPKAVKLYIEGYWKRRKNEWEKAEYQSWLTGLYNISSIGCSISHKVKYPKNPMEQQKVYVEDIDLTEEQKEAARQDFLARLQRMEKRFNKAKERKNGFEIVKDQGR